MNVSMQFKFLICGFFISIASFAAVPAGSPYDTQTPEYFMDDELQDNLSMPSFLLCFTKQLGAAKIVTGPTVTTYLALVDEGACDASSQVSEGAQKTSKEAATSAKAEGAGVSLKKVTTQVSQATRTAPMIVKAWVPLEEGMTAYVLGKAIAPATDEQPYGEFSFDYAIFSPDLGNIDVNTGSMSAAGTQLKWLEQGLVDHDRNEETDLVSLTSSAVINFGTGSTGSGAVRYASYSNSSKQEEEMVAGYAFNEDSFCRQNLSLAGNAVSEAEKCFFTDEAKGKKEVFSYNLYDSITGNEYNFGNRGFGVKFTSAGEVKYGFADANGVHFDEGTAKELSNGQAFTVDEGEFEGETVNLDIIQTSLIKITQTKFPLDSIDGIPFSAFLKENNSVTNLTEAGEYTIFWNKVDKQFVATQKNFEPLSTFLTFSAAEWLAASGTDVFSGFCAWAQGIGEICIENVALTSPSESNVTVRVGKQVAIADYPATLYCLDRCPNYTRIEAEKTKISNFEDEGTVYAGSYSGGSSDFITYTLNTSTFNYGEGSGDAAIGSVSSDLYEALNDSSLSYGIQTGALVTAKSFLACAEVSEGYCLRPTFDGTASEFYVFESGHRPFLQKRRLLDTANNAIEFSPPITLFFTPPDSVAKYGKYADVEIALEYNGDDIWGIPASCLNTTTGVFTDNCYKNGTDSGSGVWPWVDQFKLPKNETDGVLYTGRGKTGTSILAAQNEGVVFLGLDDSAIGTLTLGAETDLPTANPANVGPNGGANYIGAEPTQPSSPSIRAGEKVGG